MDWEAIRIEYESSNLTLKALADKHDIKIGTLKSRKSREGWARDATQKDATPKSATKKKKVATSEPVFQSDELNDKQKMFCLYYLKYFNATKSYQKAYECGYESAMRNGHRLLRKDEIKSELDRLKAEKQAGVFLDAQAVLQKYIDIAFADITDFMTFGRETKIAKVRTGDLDEDGNEIFEEEEYSYNYVSFKNHDEVDGTLISEVKQGKDGVSIKLTDKMKALEFLSKHFDMVPDQHKRRIEEEKLKLAQMQANKTDDDGPIEIMISRKKRD